MGYDYDTKFDGVLYFDGDVTVPQLAELGKILGADARDHPEWGDIDGLYYIDLCLNNDYSGIKWSGDEKTYKMTESVNLVLKLMRVNWPDFNLTGFMNAQGQEIDDNWQLKMINGDAVKVELATEDIIECPHCGEKFVYLKTKGG